MEIGEMIMVVVLVDGGEIVGREDGRDIGRMDALERKMKMTTTTRLLGTMWTEICTTRT